MYNCGKECDQKTCRKSYIEMPIRQDKIKCENQNHILVQEWIPRYVPAREQVMTSYLVEHNSSDECHQDAAEGEGEGGVAVVTSADINRTWEDILIENNSIPDYHSNKVSVEFDLIKCQLFQWTIYPNTYSSSTQLQRHQRLHLILSQVVLRAWCKWRS